MITPKAGARDVVQGKEGVATAYNHEQAVERLAKAGAVKASDQTPVGKAMKGPYWRFYARTLCSGSVIYARRASTCIAGSQGRRSGIRRNWRAPEPVGVGCPSALPVSRRLKGENRP